MNARMNNGTTPLILAARNNIEGMVEDLINAKAEVNAEDEYGKTALHWATSVNNTAAVITLLQKKAIVDGKDHQVQLVHIKKTERNVQQETNSIIQ